MELCSCGSGIGYEKCCRPFHKFDSIPKTALACMMARYCAFVKLEMDFLEKSYNPDKLEGYDRDSTFRWAKESAWKGLEIVECLNGQESDEEGVVEFKAKYVSGGSEYIHHEKAKFLKREGVWFFMDGDIQNDSIKRVSPKIGRNDACPCGSGKKYKKCCLSK